MAFSATLPTERLLIAHKKCRSIQKLSGIGPKAHLDFRLCKPQAHIWLATYLRGKHKRKAGPRLQRR